MINHIFISFSVVQIYDLSYIYFHKELLSLNIFVNLAKTMFSSPRRDPPKIILTAVYQDWVQNSYKNVLSIDMTKYNLHFKTERFRTPMRNLKRLMWSGIFSFLHREIWNWFTGTRNELQKWECRIGWKM